MFLPHYVALAAWWVGWGLLLRVPRLPARRGPSETGERAGDDVTVVIPARDEESSLGGLLDDLSSLRPAGARVVVVDDHSRDRTADIARSYPFVEVLAAPALPPGWTGKAWALHAGASDVSRGVLVFLDADVRLHSDVLSRAVDRARGQGGLVSLWPYHRVKRPYEHLSALFNVVSLMASGAGSAFRSRSQRVAFGPCLVTPAEAYRAVGGHEAVRSDVADDFALARTYERAGRPVEVFGGSRDLSFRMYPGGLGSLVEGWTKNFARGALLASPLRVVGIAFWLTCALGLLTWAGGIPETLSWALYALYALQMTVLFRQLGSFGLLDGVFYPLHALFFVAVFLRSLLRTFVHRRVTWRGRSLELETRADSRRRIG